VAALVGTKLEFLVVSYSACWQRWLIVWHFLSWSLTEKPQFDGLNGYTGLEHQGQQTPTAQSRFGELGQGRGDRPGMQGTGSDSNSRRSNWF
jgi:hypothetical protein